MMSDIFQQLTFKEAIADIESLGVRVLAYPSANAVPYAVIGGRSNARWWLIPLSSRHITANGLSLFQPVLKSAQWMKRGAVTLSQMGLGWLWTKPRVYLTGEPAIAPYIGCQRLNYAYFTGTNSPHRKVAIQIMDGVGRLKGYAKLTRNPLVSELLMHEAATLDYVGNLGLQTAYVPKVLFAGDIDETTVLVTDTRKTPRTITTNHITAAHRRFVQELAHKTAVSTSAGDNWLVQNLNQRYESLEKRLSPRWKERLKLCMERIAPTAAVLGPPVLSHGDFTAWNTFVVADKLYVFDWEYASQDYPAGYDFLHFILTHPELRRQPASRQINTALKQIELAENFDPEEGGKCLLLTYLCGHALHFAGRDIGETESINSWDGMEWIADLMDTGLTKQVDKTVM